MATTVYDIARAAGVGRTTVLRALWDKDDISPETKARIKKIAAEMNYHPNHIARSLVMGQSNFVGVLTTPSIMVMSHFILELIENSLRDAGYSVLFYTSGGQPEGERRCLDQLIQNRVAGIIAIPGSNSAEAQAYQEVIDTGVKLVTIDRTVEGLETPQVIGDDYRAALLATEHLVSLGHERISYLAIPRTCHAGRERARGFMDAMTAAGLSVEKDAIIETPFSESCGEEVTAGLLRGKRPPTAILARHDIVAAGAIRAISKAGLSIPDDISLVGNGNIWCSDILKVPLTTVRHPIEQMTRIAIDSLLAMLSNQEVEKKTTVLPVELVLRSSTARPAER
jgi:LacI family transcriptional regulator